MIQAKVNDMTYEGEVSKMGDRMCPVCLRNYPRIGHESWCDYEESIDNYDKERRSK